MDENTTLLKQILAAQVLIVANQLKAENAAKGSRSTGDYTRDAAKLINQKMPELLRLVQEGGDS